MEKFQISDLVTMHQKANVKIQNSTDRLKEDEIHVLLEQV